MHRSDVSIYASVMAPSVKTGWYPLKFTTRREAPPRLYGAKSGSHEVAKFFRGCTGKVGSIPILDEKVSIDLSSRKPAVEGNIQQAFRARFRGCEDATMGSSRFTF